MNLKQKHGKPGWRSLGEDGGAMVLSNLFIVSYKLVCSLILAGVVNQNTPLFTCGLSFGQVVREQSILMKLEV